MPEYKILLDLVKYRVYVGNIERELTDFIFGSKFDTNTAEWDIPEKWFGKLLPCFDDEEHGKSLCGLKSEYELYWLFCLSSDKKAKDMAKSLVEKTQEYLMTKPSEMQGRSQFKDKREIPVEIYLRKEIRIK
jgi:hypothetical protein